MTSIGVTAVNPFPVSAPKVLINGADPSTANSAVIAPVEGEAEEGSKELRVDSAGASIDAVKGGGDPVAELKKQIEQTQKMLAQQQQELASAQRSQATEEQKAQRVMTIQAQIAVTSSTLQTLQAALLQAMFSVDVHA